MPQPVIAQKISEALQVVHGRINLGYLDGTLRTVPVQEAGVALPVVEVLWLCPHVHGVALVFASLAAAFFKCAC